MNPPTPPGTYAGYSEPEGSRAEVRAVAGNRETDPDARLLARMREGEERALGELYDRWQPRVHGLALALLGDASEAEDVTEETFWQAWRQAARFDGGRGSAGGWLLTIARSRALDRLRARRRRPEEPLEDAAASAAASASTAADDAMELDERGRTVRSALESLPAEQREVLLLAYFGGLSQTEIAERTGQPLGTIKTRVRLGMAKLREALGALREGAG